MQLRRALVSASNSLNFLKCRKAEYLASNFESEMGIALEIAKRALATNDVPVGAIVISPDGKYIILVDDNSGQTTSHLIVLQGS